VYKKYIKVYDKNQILNKSKVLKIRNDFFHSYYCKSNICIQVDSKSLPLLFIEIPDEDGNIKRYISKSYRYNDIKSFRYSTIESGNGNNFISYYCISDSQCLTNKCINGACIFNEENPSEFCTNIYRYSIFFEGRSYMHCGKEINDICKRNRECASRSCGKNGYCTGGKLPSDTDGILELIILIYHIYKDY